MRPISFGMLRCGEMLLRRFILARIWLGLLGIDAARYTLQVYRALSVYRPIFGIGKNKRG